LSGFAADWLELREPADRAARSSAVVDAVRGREARTAPRSVVDLGSGTGANLRYLAPRLGGHQEWVLVDDDPALPAAARAKLIEWGRELGATVVPNERAIRIGAPTFTCSVRTAELDLARDLADLALPRGCLVTASALLDLVSAPWLEGLADLCQGAAAQVLFALTYDGRMELTPRDADDDFARQCFNRHQLSNKGFGPALGPDAVAVATRVFAARGYELCSAPSDWSLDASRRRLQAEMLEGWLAAAVEIAPDEAPRLERWHARHRRRVDAGGLRFVVGHADFAGGLAK
jgi:SAM-dependent methyltransferase